MKVWKIVKKEVDFVFSPIENENPIFMVFVRKQFENKKLTPLLLVFISVFNIINYFYAR